MGIAKYRSEVMHNFPDTPYSFSVAYIECDLADITVKNIGNLTVPNSGKYGVNGTFFNPDNKDLLGVAIQNGLVLKNYGGSNGLQGSRNRGTIFMYNNGILDKSIVAHATDKAAISNFKWAIGGISLHCDQPLTKSEYYAAIRNNEGAAGINDMVGPDNNTEPALRPRTAIGYKTGGKMLLVTVDQCTPWYTRLIMTRLGCVSHASLLLDGGGSSSFRAKKSDGNVISWHGNGIFGARSVQSMVTVSNSASWE
jgi:exopolysaccharide biosynthesis protein